MVVELVPDEIECGDAMIEVGHPCQDQIKLSPAVVGVAIVATVHRWNTSMEPVPINFLADFSVASHT